MLYYFDYLMLLYFMGTKFIFIYSLFDCILENEEEPLVANQDEDIVLTLEQTRMSTSNATLVDSIQSKMQGLFSEFFTVEKLSMLSSEEVIALDKRINMFSQSIRSIFNPQVTPRTIALPRSGTNIEAIQAHVTMTRLGHRKPGKGKEAVASHENLSGT
jgi:hypothetical protein